MPLPTPGIEVLSEPNLPQPSETTDYFGEEVGNAVGTALELAHANKVGRVTDSLAAELDTETNNWWQETHEAIAAPNVADIFNVDEEDLQAAPQPVQELMEEVARQRLAADQGAITGTELKVRHEATLRKYLNRHPELTTELQTAAGQTIGYNPLGAHIDQMMESFAATQGKTGEEWAALDKYADAVGVDMTLKSINPVGYYTQLVDFARRDTEYEYLNRELNITKVQKEARNIVEMERFRRVVGSNIMGRAGGLVGKISRMAQAAGIGGKADFAEIVPALRNEVAAFNLATRTSVMRDFPEITQEQLDAFMGPIEQNMELAMKSTSVEEMQNALQLYRTQAQAQIYAEFPEVANLEMVSELTRGLPQIEGLLMKSDLTGAYMNMIYGLVGEGTVYGGSGRSFEPANQSPPDREAFYSGLVNGMYSALPRAAENPKYYPILKRQTMQMFDFLDKESSLGTSGSKKANEDFLRFWEDPRSAEIMRNGQVTNEEAAKISKGVSFAVSMIRHQAQADRKAFAKARSSVVPGRLLDQTPGGGPSRPVTMNDLLEMSLDGQGNVHMEANWANVNIDPNKLPRSTVNAVDQMVAEAEVKFGRRMGQAIKLIAHMQGSTAYGAVASRYSAELKAPLIEALMLPEG